MKGGGLDILLPIILFNVKYLGVYKLIYKLVKIHSMSYLIILFKNCFFILEFRNFSVIKDS